MTDIFPCTTILCCMKICGNLFSQILMQQLIVDQSFIQPLSFYNNMGKVDKGVACSVQGCDQIALRSMSGSKAAMAIDLMVDSSSKRIYLCRQHYKDWKKATKEDRDNERARWD